MANFLVFIQDGEERRKLRVQLEKNYIAGNELADAIAIMLSIDEEEETTVVIEIYDTNTNQFVMLRECNEQDISKLGTKLLCSLKYEDNRNRKNSSLLSIQGRYFQYNNGMMISRSSSTVVGTVAACDDVFIEVHERFDKLGAGTGLNVWDGAILLVKYLEQNQQLIRGKNMIELGAGCGLVGIAAAILGAKSVILTDLPYTMGLLEQNVARNKDKLLDTISNTTNCCKKKICCYVWDWFDKKTIPTDDILKDCCDVLLLADCVWVQNLVLPLVNAIKSIIAIKKSMKEEFCILVSYQRRGQIAHDLFWNSMKELFTNIDCMVIHGNDIKPKALSVYKLSGII